MRLLLRLCLWLALPVALSAALPKPTFTAKELAQGYVDGRLIARPKTGSRLAADIDEASSGLMVRRRFDRFRDLRVLEIGSGETVKAAVARLRSTGHYDYVEPDQIRYARTTPNDPRFATQWSLLNPSAPSHDIDATTAWNTIHDASNVIVGVLDSGIRFDHQDLAANLWTSSSDRGEHGISAVRDSGAVSDYYPYDSEVGHGTHVSGIIGAVGNNGVGISGVAWRVQLMGLRFLHGTDGSGSVSDAVTCIDYAIKHGAQIINGSYGSSTYSSAEYDAIAAARDAGIIFVAAAGNDSLNTDHGNDYPAGYALDNIVTVAATDRTDTLADFSNFGPGSVDLAAPGVDIVSTYNGSSADYTTLSGTSMAAPHVTGSLALLRARYPSETYRQIINRLLRGADHVASLSGQVQTGGRLNVARALATTTNRPFNDDFASRATLSGEEIHVRSSNVGATTESGEPTTAGSATLWWTWKAPATATVTVDTIGSGYDTRLAVYTGSSFGTLQRVASDDNSGGSGTSKVTLTATSGTTYVIAVGGKGSATGFTALHVGTVPGNDAFASARTLSGANFQVAGTTLNASRESREPLAVTHAAGHSVWYKWVAPASGHKSLAAFATAIDTVAAVYTGSSVSVLTRIAANDNNQDGGNSDALVSFTATKGRTYYLQIDHYSDPGTTGGDFILTLTDSLWEYPTFDEVTSSPAVTSGGTVYFGSIDGTVYAVNQNGHLVWSHATGDAIDGASPAIGADKTIYIGSNDGKLYAFNGSTGAVKWTFTAKSAIGSSPAIAADGTIYFRDNAYLYALTDKGTSVAKKWTYTLSADPAGTYASPTIGSDGTIYVGSSGSMLYAVTAGGTTKWRCPVAGDIYTSVSIGGDGTLYFGTLRGRIYALKDAGKKASKSWSRVMPGSKSVTSSIAIARDGTLYFGGYDHLLHALTSTGADKWTYNLGAEVRACSPAIGANGTVYVGTYGGTVLAISPAGHLQRTFPTALKIRSSPVIAGTRLYFGSSDAKLHAFNIGYGPQKSSWAMFQGNQSHNGRRP